MNKSTYFQVLEESGELIKVNCDWCGATDRQLYTIENDEQQVCKDCLQEITYEED